MSNDDDNNNKSTPLLTTLSLLLLLQHSAGQPSTPAASPGPPAPTDIYKILTKGGQYTILIRLMRTTKVGDQINNELNGTSELTFFAPTDNAFSNLETGTLNQLTDQQKVQLLQYHIVPSFISISGFQTLSNPIQTQASDTYQFPLNVTTDPNSNQVNITTGVVNATVSNTVYSDDRLAVYQLDKVLKPLGIFAPRSPPPAPAPAVAIARSHSSGSDSDTVDASGGGIVIVSSSILVFALLGCFLVTYVSGF